MDTNYIVAALKSGFTGTQIAEGLGVSASAVAQHIEKNNLAQLAAENSKFQAIDDDLNEIESMVASKLKKSLKLAVLQPMQLARLLQIVNGTKRRSLAEGKQVIDQTNVRLVQLNFTPRANPQVVKNARNEVIEVSGRSLQTLPSGKLAEKLERKEISHDSQSEKKISAGDYI